MNPQLVAKIRKTSVPPDEQEAAENGRWGLALSLATKRLGALARSAQQSLAKWKHRAHAVSGAAAGVTSACRTPQTLQSSDGRTLANRPAIASALREHWKHVFGADAPTASFVQSFQALSLFLILSPPSER